MSDSQETLPPINAKLWYAAEKTAWQVAKEIQPAFAAMEWMWGGTGSNDEGFVPSVNDIAQCLRAMLKEMRKTLERSPSPRLWQRTGRLFVEVAFDDYEEWCCDMGLLDSHGVDVTP